LVSWDRTRLRKGTTAETQTLAASQGTIEFMDIVLKAKHWQIFGGFILLTIVASIITDIGPIADTVISLIMGSIYFGWILLLGYGLSKRLGTLHSTGFKLFVTANILLIVSGTLSEVLVATGITAKNQNILVMVFLAAYVITLLAIIGTYPAKTLKMLESKEENDINNYFGDIFLFLFLPLGTWIIQPRINKLVH